MPRRVVWDGWIFWLMTPTSSTAMEQEAHPSKQVTLWICFYFPAYKSEYSQLNYQMKVLQWQEIHNERAPN